MVISVGGILSAFAPDYNSLLVIRGFVGFGIGGLNIPFDLLAEFVPAPDRGKFLMYVLMITIILLRPNDKYDSLAACSLIS